MAQVLRVHTDDPTGPPYYTILALGEIEGGPSDEHGNETAAESGPYCTSLAVPKLTTVPFTSECPIDDLRWFRNACILYCAWSPCVILLLLILSGSGSGSSSSDGDGALFVLGAMIFVVVWGLFGGTLTAYVLPRHPNCLSETEMGGYVAVSHASMCVCSDTSMCTRTISYHSRMAYRQRQRRAASDAWSTRHAHMCTRSSLIERGAF